MDRQITRLTNRKTDRVTGLDRQKTRKTKWQKCRVIGIDRYKSKIGMQQDRKAGIDR